ncbi:hypothetical protein V5F38_17505 [Xanthobacter sp. V0B-10]|uniref:hypothetical protein n=1 Tax=Xanthobacter albus TaxID=3119929 RepID=UPI0037286081
MKPWIRDRLRALASASRLGTRDEAAPREAMPAEPAPPGTGPAPHRPPAPVRRLEPTS